MKPGYLTTEFWLTLSAQVIPLLVIFGLIPDSDKDSVGQFISSAIAQASAFIASAIAIWKYIQSRLEVKTIGAKAEIEKAKVQLASIQFSNSRSQIG